MGRSPLLNGVADVSDHRRVSAQIHVKVGHCLNLADDERQDAPCGATPFVSVGIDAMEYGLVAGMRDPGRSISNDTNCPAWNRISGGSTSARLISRTS
jgi:hypothetical protein